MLYDIVDSMRKRQIDIMFVSDVGSPDWVEKVVHYVAIEEFMWIIFGKVAIILSRPMVNAWRQAGEKVRFDKDSDRWLAADIRIGEQDMAIISTYAPTQSGTAATTARNNHFEAGSRLRAQPSPEMCIVGGDLNSHIGKAAKGAEQFAIGHMGLSTPTTAKAHQMIQWIQTEGLFHVNSHVHAIKRGTWWHAVAKQWYEQDVFISSIPCKAGRWQSIRTFTIDGVDHKACQITLQILEGTRRTITNRSHTSHRASEQVKGQQHQSDGIKREATPHGLNRICRTIEMLRRRP